MFTKFRRNRDLAVPFHPGSFFVVVIFVCYSKDDSWRISWFLPLVFSRINIPLNSQSFFTNLLL